MVYLTQLIYLNPGKEAEFLEFESKVLPIMSEYTGKIIQRIRPEKEAFVEGEEDQPYEVHIISFESESSLEQYLKDERRIQFTHLKDISVRSTLLIKEQK